MALLGLISEFEATHGSREKRKNKFTIELTIEGEIESGFVAGMDYIFPRNKLNQIANQLAEKYLDDIVGRATNENIAQFIMFNLSDLPVHTLRIYEGEKTFVEISKTEFDAEHYPAQLAYNLGQSFLLREEPDLAKEQLTKAIDLNPNFAEAYNLRGRSTKYLEGYAPALDDFLKAVELKSDFGEAWRNLGNAFLYLERFDEMVSAFDKSVELMPDSALAINNRGYGYFVIGKYELALHDHEKAVHLDPNYAEAHYDKGMALTKLGRKEHAEKALHEATKLNDSGEDTFHEIKMY